MLSIQENKRYKLGEDRCWTPISFFPLSIWDRCFEAARIDVFRAAENSSPQATSGSKEI